MKPEEKVKWPINLYLTEKEREEIKDTFERNRIKWTPWILEKMREKVKELKSDGGMTK